MKLGGIASIMTFDPFSQEQAGTGTTTTSETMNLGDYVNISDSRAFRYAVAGASNLVAGKVATEPASKANHLAISPSAAAAAGAFTVSVTVGATAVVAGEYNEGWLAVTGTPGNGQMYKINNSPAIVSSGTGVITLAEPIQVALTTGSTVSLIHNPWAGTVEGTTQTRHAAGTPLLAITAANYYWAQTKGYAAVLNDGNLALGTAVVLSGSVAGAVAVASTTFATSVLTPYVGYNTIATGVDTKNAPLVLTID